MATDGHGSARIVLVGRTPEQRPPAGEPARRPVTDEARSRAETTAATGWTLRRLINGAAFALVATIAGGIVFQKNFQLFGDNNRQLLAMGFGLFVVGMVVLTLCLIGLAAAAVRALAASQGWAAAVLLLSVPAVPLVALNMLGVIGYAFPSLFVIIIAGGFALALKR